MRQFCVDVMPIFVGRNIDAELLREHSVRRDYAYFNFPFFCVISPLASTHASFLRKPFLSNFFRVRKKEKKAKNMAGLEPTNLGHLDPKTPVVTTQPLVLYLTFTLNLPLTYTVHTVCYKKDRNFGAILAHASTYAPKFC